MGQTLSRKVEPTGSAVLSRETISAHGKSKHIRPHSNRHAGNSSGPPEPTRRNAREVPRTRTSDSEQRSSNQSNQPKLAGGHYSAPRRQQKHGRSRAREDLQHASQNDRHQPSDRQKNTKTKLHHSKSGSHHAKLKLAKECIVCADTRTIHHFPNRPPTEECTHDTDVCRRCLRTWIKSEFKSKIWNEINCPVCTARFQYDDIKEFAPRDVFHRYAKLTTKAIYDSIPNWRWCITKGCKSGQLHDPNEAKFRCKSCKNTHCIEHGSTWHKGETCQQYDYRKNKRIKKQEEAASKKMISETTKKCPGCDKNIEKSYGCDHMTCSQCKHQFCWLCFAPYIYSPSPEVDHRSGCIYFADSD